MRRFIIILALFSLAFGGTISGRLIYPHGGLGTYFVTAMTRTMLLQLLAGSISITDMPTTMLLLPGSYTLNSDSIVDGRGYIVLGAKRRGLILDSGDPMGMYPEDVYTTGGVATGIDVELDTIGHIRGHIRYMGSYDNLKLNIYTFDFSARTFVVETVYNIRGAEYDVISKSGLKILVAYDDLNGNNMPDSLPRMEPMGTYLGEWGPFIFVGGGGRFSDSINIFVIRIPGVEETQIPDRIEFYCSPNPFNANGRIVYNINGTGELSIFDVSGNIIYECPIFGRGEVKVNFIRKSGMYIARLKYAGGVKSIKFCVIK